MSIPVQISGTGTFFPETVRRNDDFAWRDAGVAPERVDRSGVLERRWASPSQTILDLADAAIARALDAAAIAPESVDRMLLVTSTFQPDLLVPSGVVALQDRLNMRRCQSTTIVDTCCGSLVAMDLAAALVRSGAARHVVVVAAETFSKTFQPSSPVTFEIGMGMGDGAGAVVLSARPGDRDSLLSSFLHSSADFQSGLGMRPSCAPSPAGTRASIAFGSAGDPPTWRGIPVSKEGLVEALQWFTSTTVPSAVREALRRAGLSVEQVDFFLLHQPNRLFLDKWKTEIGVPEPKTLDTLWRYGNLSSVSVLANLDEAWRTARIQPGDRIVMASAGEGAVWGAMVWLWNARSPVEARQTQRP